MHIVSQKLSNADQQKQLNIIKAQTILEITAESAYDMFLNLVMQLYVLLFPCGVEGRSQDHIFLHTGKKMQFFSPGIEKSYLTQLFLHRHSVRIHTQNACVISNLSIQNTKEPNSLHKFMQKYFLLHQIFLKFYSETSISNSWFHVECRYN